MVLDPGSSAFRGKEEQDNSWLGQTSPRDDGVAWVEEQLPAGSIGPGVSHPVQDGNEDDQKRRITANKIQFKVRQVGRQ